MNELAFYLAVYILSAWATLAWLVIFTLCNKMPGGGSLGAVLFSAAVGLLVTAMVAVSDYFF